MAPTNIKLKGLFLNSSKTNCSIYESGKMSYNCLVLSTIYSLDYQEVDESSRDIRGDYDFYIFNYHITTMGWLNTKLIREIRGFKVTIVLEVAPNNPFIYCAKEDFDAYIVLDPTLQTATANVYSFPRPLEVLNHKSAYSEKEIPEIGSFGFATQGKGFDKVIDAVNREFDKAIIRINIPRGDYVPIEWLEQLTEELNNYPTKKEIKVVVTNHFFDKEQLIAWCAQNTLNLFLYNRNIQGLAATIDQAIACGRPLAVSTDNSFRHIHSYLTPYPFQSLKDSILSSQKIVTKINEAWAPIKFAIAFEKVLKDFKVAALDNTGNVVTLPQKIQQPSLPVNKIFNLKKSDFLPPIAIKTYRKIFKRRTAKVNEVQKDNIPIQIAYKTLEPFMHYTLQSYSQFNEDILIDILLGKREKGTYVDIGANDSSFNSNTKRFYSRGWSGINVEPNKKAFDKLAIQRPNDINLNLAVSDREAELTFYNLSNDSTLSTLDFEIARMTADKLNLNIISVKVKSLPINKILDEYLKVAVIDFMSVDAEGHDLTVLKSNNWDKYRPSLVIVESNHDFTGIRALMDAKDYLHIYSNFYNAIFVDKRTKDQELLSNLKWKYLRGRSSEGLIL